MRSECACFPRPGRRDRSLSGWLFGHSGAVSDSRARGTGRRSLQVPHGRLGVELQGALSASGWAGTRRSRQGALRNPESRGLRAPPPALPPGGAGCRWRALRTATEAGTVGGE